MRNSLIFKLMGAFLLVIAIGALVMAWFISRATQNAFNLYTTRNGQAWAQRLAPILGDYYALNGNWQGVDTVLQSNLTSMDTPGMKGNGTGLGRGMGFGRQLGGGGMGGMMDQRLILTDGQGIVIRDTSGELDGRPISSAGLKNGTPVLVNGNLVGTLIVTPADNFNSATPAGQFLASVNQSVITSVLIAGGIALILGTILFLQITSPVRQLNKAATAIAQGDLSQRVAIRSQDELGKLSQTFNQMGNSLERAAAQRQQVMADVAHELRTPLTVIQANLEGMLDGVLPLDAEQVAAIHTETLLLNRLVSDLRLLSLAEAGELKLEYQDASVGELIQRVVERIKPQAQQKGIFLEAEIQEDLPKRWIDPDRITQVLNNLIGNALRYTPQDGKITVRAVTLSSPTGVIQISVTDTGPGIDLDALPFIFDRFYRADKSRARVSGGSGLGLAIVKQLVEAHGGEVKAVSPIFLNKDQMDYGTQISFTLPGKGRNNNPTNR